MNRFLFILLMSASAMFCSPRCFAQSPGVERNELFIIPSYDYGIDWTPTDPNSLKPFFAVKSNLLFDFVVTPNIEVEVPIRSHWSVAAEWIFPWWLSHKKQRCYELLNANLEGRYWFGESIYTTPRKQLTGWFVGLYVGGGYYDFEWNRRGHQGEFVIAGGVSGGYAHSIWRNLRMEYSLGVGMLFTKYRKYHAEVNPSAVGGFALVRQSYGRYTWIGPTRAKVSLVWMINAPIKRGGVR